MLGMPPSKFAAVAEEQTGSSTFLWTSETTGFIKMTRTTAIAGYTIFGIANRNGRGHSVAAYTSLHGGVRFFDPKYIDSRAVVSQVARGF